MVLAADIRVFADLPAYPIAYSDGWAVNAQDLVGASAYSAAILNPLPNWIEAGNPMPAGFDSVLPRDAIAVSAAGIAEASTLVAPGEGVRNTGQDIKAGALLVAAGTRLGPQHIGILKACGLPTVEVRAPRCRIVLASAAAERHFEMVRMWLGLAGTVVVDKVSARGVREDIAAAYERPGVDFVLSLGGTGQGRTDCAVVALADAGEVVVHGVALRPGGSAAFGRVDTIPVLLLSGRIDGVVAGMLVLAAKLIGGLSGLLQPDWLASFRLSAKTISTIGLTDFFLGLPEGDLIRPLPLEEAGFEALGRAVGWFTVPPGSEGYHEGHRVHLRQFQPR